MVVKFVLIRRFRKYDHKRNCRSSGNFCFPRLSCKIRRDKISQFAEKYRSLFLVVIRPSPLFYRKREIIFRSFFVEKKIVDRYNWQALSKLRVSFAKRRNPLIRRSLKVRGFTCSPLIRRYLRYLAYRDWSATAGGNNINERFLECNSRFLSIRNSILFDTAAQI